MKDWVRDNGGYSRGATVGGKVGVEFVFFDEESSVAFCLTFGVSPDKCVKGIKKCKNLLERSFTTNCRAQ